MARISVRAVARVSVAFLALRSCAEDVLRAVGRRYELVRHHFAQGSIQPWAGAMHRNQDIGIDGLEFGHGLLEIRIVGGKEMEPPRMACTLLTPDTFMA